MTRALAAAIRDIPLPERMRKLPLSDKGFPVPWFVGWLDENSHEVERGQGTPDFRMIGRDRLRKAWGSRVCWLCGEPLGRFQVLVVGPMCVVNRTTSEPGSHLECARYAVKACPFLAHPRMRRNEVDQAAERLEPPGIHIDHNPGVMALWTTRHIRPFNPAAGAAGIGRPGTLFRFLDDPDDVVTWWCHGRAASRAEVQAAMDKGLPHVRAVAEAEGALAEFEKMRAGAERFLP
jgi:hypothetical protein